MNKDKFKTIIKILTIKEPKSSYKISEYNNNSNEFDKFEYISYKKRLMCTDYKNLIQTSTYISQKNDKLFFSAGCTIPRTKVREWGKDKKISITTKPEKANICVISTNWFNNLFDYYSQYYDILLDKNNFIKFLTVNYADKDFLSDLIYDISCTTSDKILLGRFNNTNMLGYDKTRYGNHNKTLLTKSEKLEKGIISTYIDLCGDSEFIEAEKNEDNDTFNEFRLVEDSSQKRNDLNKLFDLNDSVTTILDTSLIDIVNESAITIDNEMYDQLSTMLNSEDRKNYIIAMEIIANCNYRTSLHKILLLFKNIGWRVYDCPEKNHVNFKSLVKFIDLYNWYDPSYDDIINSLMAKKYLTKEILEEIMPLVKTEIKSDISNYHSVFKVNTITVSNQVKRYFGVNIPLSKKELEDLKELEENT